MSFPLAVIQQNPAQKCARGGACCRALWIKLSPREMRSRWERRVRQKIRHERSWRSRLGGALEIGDSVYAPCLREDLRSTAELIRIFGVPPRDANNPSDDILVIWPMLRVAGCSGRLDISGIKFYMYGPCANLRTDESGKAACGIQSLKPWMCDSFPFRQLGDFKGEFQNQNPSPYRGCGYNLSTNSGRLESEWMAAAQLSPCEPHEL